MLKEANTQDLKGNSRIAFSLGVSTLSWAEGKLVVFLQLLKNTPYIYFKKSPQLMLIYHKTPVHFTGWSLYLLLPTTSESPTPFDLFTLWLVALTFLDPAFVRAGHRCLVWMPFSESRNSIKPLHPEERPKLQAALLLSELCRVLSGSGGAISLPHSTAPQVPCLEEAWIPSRYPALLPSSLWRRSEADIWHWYLTALPLEVLFEFTPQNKKISYLFPTGWNIFFSSFSLRLGGFILMHLQTKWDGLEPV